MAGILADPLPADERPDAGQRSDIGCRLAGEITAAANAGAGCLQRRFQCGDPAFIL